MKQLLLDSWPLPAVEMLTSSDGDESCSTPPRHSAEITPDSRHFADSLTETMRRLARLGTAGEVVRFDK